MKFKSSFTLIFSSLLVFTACQGLEFQDPEFKTMKSVSVLSADLDSLILEGTCVMYNPNVVALDLSSMEFDVIVNEQQSGVVRQTLDTQMPAQSEFEFPVRFSVSPKDIWGDDGSSILDLGIQLFTKREFDIIMDGNIKAGLKGYYVKVPFDHTENIKLKK